MSNRNRWLSLCVPILISSAAAASDRLAEVEAYQARMAETLTASSQGAVEALAAAALERQQRRLEAVAAERMAGLAAARADQILAARQVRIPVPHLAEPVPARVLPARRDTQWAGRAAPDPDGAASRTAAKLADQAPFGG